MKRQAQGPRKKNGDQRLTPKDWVDAAVARMLRSGVDGVRIDRLARDLKATKGSFYWHFSNRAALLNALLRRWEEITLQLNELLDTEEPDPARRLLRLLHLPEEMPPAHISNGDFERAVRNWSMHSPEVQRVVSHVDRVRERHHVKMFEQMGVRSERALVLARISGSISGPLWMGMYWSRRERDEYIRASHAMLMQAIAQDTAPITG